MSAVDVVVIGGGIAGLSALRALAPDTRAVLLEREALLASHASGRNAAIFRPLELDASTATLALRTRELLAELAPRADPGFVQPTGLLLASATRARVDALLAHGHANMVACELYDARAICARVPVLAGGELAHAAWVPGGGVLDLHALHGALASEARAKGAEIRTGSGVTELGLDASGQRVAHVSLEDGTRIATGAVVLAAGAFSDGLARAIGAGLPLTPVRRHLVQLVSSSLPAEQAVVWRIDDELYFRPESGGVLASPCDERAWSKPAAEPASDATVLETLAQKLARTAPGLARAEVRRYWACLRTFAPDRELVVGEDPRVQGLYWLGGLGGRGMSVGPAAGELLAACVRGETYALAKALAPARLLGGDVAA